MLLRETFEGGRIGKGFHSDRAADDSVEARPIQIVLARLQRVAGIAFLVRSLAGRELLGRR